MLKNIIKAIHIILFIFAVIIALLDKPDYYAYIYAISLCQKINYSFDTIVFAFFCTLVIGIIDMAVISVSAVKIFAKNAGKKDGIKNNTAIWKILIWIFMLGIAVLTMYMYLANYIMWIT